MFVHGEFLHVFVGHRFFHQQRTSPKGAAVQHVGGLGSVIFLLFS